MADSGYVDNWQTEKTVTECNLHMLTTEDCSDVIFRVGPEKNIVRAYRYVLVSRSCVFHAMFCGPLSEKGEVTVPDIDPKAFSEFLRYIYADTANITTANVTGLLYTSRKYAVDALFNQCANFLEKSLSEENVCQILEHCHGYGELDLEQKALKILVKAGEKVIKSPGFLDLCSGCLGKCLKSDQLNLKEEDVFHATMAWAIENCKRQNISSTPENLKKVLGDLRYEIRFCSFSLDFLVKVVRPSGMLTEVERFHIIDRGVDSTINISPFKFGSRKRHFQHASTELSSKSVMRFIRRKPYSNVDYLTGDSWPCNGSEDSIMFSASENIQLAGCYLYGPCVGHESTYSLNILLYDDQDQVIAEPVPQSERKLGGDVNKLIEVLFVNAVPLVAGRKYTISVKMTGKSTWYGTEGMTSVTANGVDFIFQNSPESIGRTTTIKGQIPGLIWR